jgi:hypothetical protein
MRETEDTNEKVAERQSEATSKETVSDLEEAEKSSNSKDESGSETSIPTPDGQLDESGGGRADGSDTGGPM